jgi:hypothetical protein
MSSEWLGDLENPPTASDFKAWGGLFAERLAEDRVRAYVKGLVERTWDLTVWLQHRSDATPDDAELVLDATGHLSSALEWPMAMSDSSCEDSDMATDQRVWWS